jgi:hypothetical protein
VGRSERRRQPFHPVPRIDHASALPRLKAHQRPWVPRLMPHFEEHQQHQQRYERIHHQEEDARPAWKRRARAQAARAGEAAVMWAPLPLPTPEWLDESGQPLLPPSVEYELLRGGRDDPVAEVFTAELLAEESVAAAAAEHVHAEMDKAVHEAWSPKQRRAQPAQHASQPERRREQQQQRQDEEELEVAPPLALRRRLAGRPVALAMAEIENIYHCELPRLRERTGYVDAAGRSHAKSTRGKPKPAAGRAHLHATRAAAFGGRARPAHPEPVPAEPPPTLMQVEGRMVGDSGRYDAAVRRSVVRELRTARQEVRARRQERIECAIKESASLPSIGDGRQ